MSAELGAGDWVECVDAAPQDVVPTRLMVGALYRIEAIVQSLVFRDTFAWVLVGVRHPGNPDGSYGPNRFRPIRGDEALLTITTDSKADQPETVT